MMLNKMMVLILLAAVALANGPLAVLAGKPQTGHNRISNLTLEIIQEQLYLSWDLLNPHGYLSMYKILWNGEAQVQDESSLTSKHHVKLAHPTHPTCFQPLNITVVALDKEGAEIGQAASQYYVWQDIVTDIKVQETEKGNEKMISAKWSLKCRSKLFTTMDLTSWRDTETIAEGQSTCEYAHRGDTHFSAICSDRTDNLCPSYYIKIQSEPRKPSITVSGDYSTFKIEQPQLLYNSVYLKWNNLNTVCGITRYTINYIGTTMWGDEKIHSVSRSSQPGEEMLHLDIDDLWPYTSYNCCVTAKRLNGSDLHDCAAFNTKESRPSAPTSIGTYTERHGSSLQISWQEPSKMNGNLLKYVIQWAAKGAVGQRDQTNSAAYTIDGLDYCIQYNITVRAINGAGEGEAAWITTEIGNECSINERSPTSPPSAPTTESFGPQAGETKLNQTPMIVGLNVLGIVIVGIIIFVIVLFRYPSFYEKIRGVTKAPDEPPASGEETSALNG